MKKFIPVCVALLAIFATGESLICHTCGLSVGGKCLYSSSKFCPSSEPNCYWGKLAQCLTCRQCPIGISGICFFGSKVTCDNATQSCYSGDAQFNATASLTLHTRGCLDSDLCGSTLTGNLLGAGYTARFQCCTTDMCNGAASVQLSLTVALCAAVLSSLWGLWDL
ncbi:hypothetical protein L3Q82_015130 [Scortum barcoo]|uniref:Uncharacterized protein n=1 Tax=Scortum barcoo TaxID=214431 RepID=A0ACB8VT03_9TELE|nr:hypothetical protein L3Q82_015130 [Scortum barcoo]